MPSTSPKGRHGRLRVIAFQRVPATFSALVKPGLSLLLAFILSAAGCRIFRSHRVSDESISAARQLSLQGMDAQRRGQWDRSETLFAAAILKCPGDERARSGYAESLWHRGASTEAIAHMEEAVRLSGNDPDRSVRLGQMYRARGDWARAGQQAEQAIAANPQSALAWALRGQVLQAQGNRVEALASYHRALSCQPALPEVQLAVAEIYSQENRPQRALATLQSLASTFPERQAPPDLLIRQGLALRALARHQDAARMLSQAANRIDPPPDLLLELARTHMLAGDAAAARQSLDKALDREPRHAGCLALRDELMSRDGAVMAASARQPLPR